MKRSEMRSWVCAGIFVLGTGCTMLENGATSNSNAVAPEPGTRAFFDQKIRGSYALDGKDLVKIYVPFGTFGTSSSAFGSRTLSSSIPLSTTISSRAQPGESVAQWVEGSALQIISNNLVVVGKIVTNVSGVATCQRSCLVSLLGTCLPKQGTSLRLLAVSDGTYNTYSDGTQSSTLTAYREVPEPTFEDYLKICERDSKASVVPPLISVERVVAGRPLPPGLVRSGSSTLGTPGYSPALIPGATNEPKPGTRAYYDLKIKDSYAFDGGELLRINGSYSSMPSPPGFSSNPQWLEGSTLQVISNNLVVIGKTAITVSGVETFKPSYLISLVGTRPPLQGDNIRILARPDGSYTYNDGTRNGSLTAYRELAPATYEEYLTIYERDSKAAVVTPIISIERNINTQAVPGVPRARVIMPRAQATPPPAPIPAPSTNPVKSDPGAPTTVLPLPPGVTPPRAVTPPPPPPAGVPRAVAPPALAPPPLPSNTPTHSVQ